MKTHEHFVSSSIHSACSLRRAKSLNYHPPPSNRSEETGRRAEAEVESNLGPPTRSRLGRASALPLGPDRPQPLQAWKKEALDDLP